MKGYISIVVLKSISESKKGQSGYGLMKSIEERCGKKPSAGSIYPILKELLKEGLVTVKKEGKKKIYITTPASKEYLIKFSEHKNQMIENVQHNVRYAGTILGLDAHKDVVELLDRMKSGEPPFGEFTHDMMQFRKILIPMLIDESLTKKKKATVRKILLKATKDLKAIKKSV